MFYFSKYTWDILFHTHNHHTEGGEKEENWCDVSVFFLLVSGVKVESLWHFCVFVCLWWLVCVCVRACVRVSAPVDRTNLRLVKKLWLFTQQCGMWQCVCVGMKMHVPVSSLSVGSMFMSRREIKERGIKTDKYSVILYVTALCMCVQYLASSVNFLLPVCACICVCVCV